MLPTGVPLGTGTESCTGTETDVSPSDKVNASTKDNPVGTPKGKLACVSGSTSIVVPVAKTPGPTATTEPSEPCTIPPSLPSNVAPMLGDCTRTGISASDPL